MQNTFPINRKTMLYLAFFAILLLSSQQAFASTGTGPVTEFCRLVSQLS